MKKPRRSGAILLLRKGEYHALAEPSVIVQAVILQPLELHFLRHPVVYFEVLLIGQALKIARKPKA